MRILYDSQIFDMQKSGGISRYFCEIMRNLPTDFAYNLATKYSQNIYLNEKHIVSLEYNELKAKRDIFIPSCHFRGKEKLQRIRNKIFYNHFKTNRFHDIEALKKQDFDVFHPSYYDPYFLEYIGSKPFVLTIHDMIHEKYAELFCDINTIKNKKLLAQKAAHIIAISETTKQDVIDIFGISESKISVVYHGNMRMAIDDSISENIYSKYLLFIGTRTSYKNFYFMLIALSDWLKSHGEVKLICTASDFSDFEKSMIEELGLENQVIHMFFDSDSQMHNFYKNSLAFIYPSYYEGFGIPILEAFEAQCPVILADTACFREIAGDAAIYFDPKSKAQIVNAVDSVFKNTLLKQDLIKKGKNRIMNFSWEKSAKQTADIYYKIANKFKKN